MDAHHTNQSKRRRGKVATVDRIKFIHALLNDTRAHLIATLFQKNNNISGLLEQPRFKGVDRSTLCYHLNVLEEVGLIKSKYVILEAPYSKGRAGRFYEVDRNQLAKAMTALESLKREISAK